MKVELRPLDELWAAEMARMLNDYQIWKNLSDIIPFPYTEQDARDFIARVQREGSPVKNTFAVLTDGRMAGVVGYEYGKFNKSHIATVGYWYGREFWGEGIATSALGLLLEKIACDPQVKRIEASAFDFNLASQRVMEKCGFVREAQLKDALSKEGHIYDEVLYHRSLEAATKRTETEKNR